MPVATIVYKHHFWSPELRDDWLPENELGARLREVYFMLFAKLHMSQLPQAQKLELYRQRIAIWNSDFPDRASQRADIEKLPAENAALFPPRDH